MISLKSYRIPTKRNIQINQRSYGKYRDSNANKLAINCKRTSDLFIRNRRDAKDPRTRLVFKINVPYFHNIFIDQVCTAFTKDDQSRIKRGVVQLEKFSFFLFLNSHPRHADKKKKEGRSLYFLLHAQTSTCVCVCNKKNHSPTHTGKVI